MGHRRRTTDFVHRHLENVNKTANVAKRCQGEVCQAVNSVNHHQRTDAEALTSQPASMRAAATIG